MRHTVTTLSGSIYLLSDVTLLWERLKEGEQSINNVRQPVGKLLVFPEIKVGEELFLLCEKVNQEADGRLIITSPVVSIEMTE